MQIIQKKEIWILVCNEYFLRSLNYVNIKYMRFCLYHWKWGTHFILSNLSPLTIKEGFLVFITWTKRGVIEKTLKRVSWKGGSLRKGRGFPNCFISFLSEKHVFISIGILFPFIVWKNSRLLQSIDPFFHEVYFLLENDILWNFFSSYSYF